MYSATHQPTTTSMNGMGGGIIDGSGTINPAALNSAGLANAQAVNTVDSSPRGVKRSRSPEQYGDVSLGTDGDDNDDSKPRKRGRPPKPLKGSGQFSPSPNLPTAQHPSTSAPLAQNPSPGPAKVRTPQLPNQPLPQPTSAATPAQTSPPKPTPTKAVVKALPTVRDHTTDQLGPDQDEYIPREYDDAGERKVTATGHPLDGREYRCRTFFVPNRHDKLFMLATECARVLGYRDSYLLFNKNRSLYKIIATQAEKDDLIHQEILPYSYRSRQIAIVTAKSMFRQFGSRVIVNGRRVRDDYWESKARKQGFTEDDLAGEKRPGAAKARDAAAQEAANANAAAAVGHHTDIVYSGGPAHLDSHLQPQTVQPGMVGANSSSLAPLPMILPPTDDMRIRDYGNVPRPRQEMSGQPYQDRTQASSNAEIMNQAHQSSEYNKTLSQQRDGRGKWAAEFWNKPRESPSIATTQAPTASADHSAPANHSLASPGINSGTLFAESHQPVQQPQRGPPQMINAQGISQQTHQQNPLAQSPIRSIPQGAMRPEQIQQHRSPSLNLSSTPGQGNAPYSYQHHNTQMWPPPPQAHQSPLSQSHQSIPQYSPQGPHQPSHQPSPHQQSPHQLHPGAPQMPGGSMHYQSMPGMPPSGYPGSTPRGVYQANPNPQQFMHQSSAGPQPSMQGWAPSGQPSQGGQQGWAWGSSG